MGERSNKKANAMLYSTYIALRRAGGRFLIARMHVFSNCEKDCLKNFYQFLFLISRSLEERKRKGKEKEGNRR
jgi:hypothetical protein